jgi:uncharacterized membrane protein required for colicin V production
VKELIDHIPFVDVFIVALLGLFIYVGWKHGLPRMLMTIAALYAGFLLASIYYHLFGAALARAFKARPGFGTDFLGFLVLDIAVTMLMLVLMFTLFGHLNITGRWAIIGRLGGSITGLAAGLLLVALTIALLRVPYEANKQNLDPNSGIAPVEAFNENYAKSALAPVFMRGAPYLVASIRPMLPLEVRAKGAVPILEPYALKQDQQ